MKIAQLLGYKDYAEYTLKKRMAENSKSVYKLLNQLLEAYTPTAQQEYKEIQELARKEQELISLSCLGTGIIIQTN